MMPRSRSALVVLLVALPIAAAESIAPTVPVDATGQLPPLPGSGPLLNIDEGPFLFEGRADAPQRILIRDAEGATAVEYLVDDEGRARLDAAGENLIADATLVRVDGDPLGDAYTLTLMAAGKAHEVRIDRAALAAQVALPDLPAEPSTSLPVPETGLPAVAVSRPLGWPSAPAESYLLFVEDAARNHLAAGSLDGSPYVQRLGQQLAVVQVPLAEMKWDRILLRTGPAGEPTTQNVTFARVRDTDTAAIFHARYDLAPLGLADGDTIDLQVVFERRLTPFVVERLPEPATYQARLDGKAPTATIQAPASADDLHFAVSWSGEDAHAGVGGFVVQYRLAGATDWTAWLAPTSERSATFSGEWGRSYEFRAYALDRVGILSATPATAGTRIVPQTQAGVGADDVNDAPSAGFAAPEPGAVLAGVATIAWTAGDPDGTPLTSRLQVSDDGGSTWRTLFAGNGLTYAWDTTSEAEGSTYSLRLVVSDGTQAQQDRVDGLTIRNIVAPPEPPAAPPEVPTPGGPAAQPTPAPRPAPAQGTDPQGASDDALDPAGEDARANEGGKVIPLPGVALLAAALGGAALLGRRRQ